MEKIKEVSIRSLHPSVLLSTQLLTFNNFPLQRQKLAALRAEADANVARAEEAEAKNKIYEADLLSRDQEITSLTHRNQLLDAQVEKLEAKVTELKQSQDGESRARDTIDAQTRKIALLENELDGVEVKLKDAVTQYVVFLILTFYRWAWLLQVVALGYVVCDH